MRKIISIVLLFMLLLSCCACDLGVAPQTDPTEVTTEPSVAEVTNDGEDFSGVNELEPNEDGVYQIHSIAGLQNMANHLDADFELLCNIDLNGANWTPVGTRNAPFTGELDGGYFTISNFVIDTPTVDGDLGFFGVQDGMVKDLIITDMTILSTAEAKQIGGFAGTNLGRILRSEATGTITATEAAADAACGAAAGINEGNINNSNVTVDICYTATGSANIGGLAGVAKDGKIQYVNTLGKLEIAAGDNKNVGLFAGTAGDCQIQGGVFLGESNTVNGELFSNYAGTGNVENITECGYRDNNREPLTEGQLILRQRVEQMMRAMGTVEWTVSESLYYSCSCNLATCHGVYTAGMECHGIPYNHKGGSYGRFLYCLGDDNVMDDWIYTAGDFDGFDMYVGNDCSTALQHAWATVSNTISFGGARNEIPDRGKGTIPVGDWAWDLEEQYTYTIDYIKATGEQRMYEAYAKLRMGDAIVYSVQEGGHTRMAAADAVVVRNADGTIDPTNSYVLMHEQGAPRTFDPYYSSWYIDYKYTFANLYFDTAVPVTIQELLDGTMEPAEVTLEEGMEGKAGLTTGILKSNYHMDSVSMVITDGRGNQIFNHTLFTNTGKRNDTNSTDFMRKLMMEWDMANFAMPLSKVNFQNGESYHCTVTVSLATGDSVTVKDYSF